MIHTTDLTKCFGSFVAVDKLNLHIAPGEIFGLLGANGAGKTTTIRILCGLLKPSSGTATVNGYEVAKHSEQIKRIIGYMSQKFSLYDDLKAKENIEFYANIYGLSYTSVISRTQELLQQLGLDNRLNIYTRDLPMGYKQRLSLLCSLVHDPPVLVLDEPTSGVDPKARREFWDLISTLAAQGKTVIVSTHYMDEAEYCHRVLIMRDGREVETGSPADLKRKHLVDNMQSLFIKLGSGD